MLLHLPYPSDLPHSTREEVTLKTATEPHPLTLPTAVPLAPPETPPDIMPISFTTAEVIRKVRRANASPAGGLSGTDYLTLRAWFDQADITSDRLTAVLNLVARAYPIDRIRKYMNRSLDHVKALTKIGRDGDFSLLPSLTSLTGKASSFASGSRPMSKYASAARGATSRKPA